METKLLKWASYRICQFQQIMDVLKRYDERTSWDRPFVCWNLQIYLALSPFSKNRYWSSGKIRRVKYFFQLQQKLCLLLSYQLKTNTDFGPPYFVWALGRIWPFLHTYPHLVNLFRVIFVALVNLVSTLLKMNHYIVLH